MCAAFLMTNARGMTPSQRPNVSFQTRLQTMDCSSRSRRRFVAFLAASLAQQGPFARAAAAAADFCSRSSSFAATHARRISSARSLFAVAGPLLFLRAVDLRPVRRFLPLWWGLMFRFVLMFISLQFCLWLCHGLATTLRFQRLGDYSFMFSPKSKAEYYPAVPTT